MKRTTALLVTIALYVLAIPPLPVAHGQNKDNSNAQQPRGTGKLVRSHRKDQNNGRPDWAEQSFNRGKAHLKEGGNAWSVGILDPDSELQYLSAEEDDLGYTHVRMDQVHNGVQVFGGQVITQLDATSTKHVFGHGFIDARDVDTKPNLSAAQAIKAAKAALGYTGMFAKQPEATLIILPNHIKDETSALNSGATLCYQVELLIEDGTPATARHMYFVNAKDGTIVWHYDAMEHVAGTGNSQYSGQVGIETSGSYGNYSMQDYSRGGMYTTDVRNSLTTGTGTIFTDYDNVWGNFANSDRATAGVDAHFGAEKTWDYYLNTYGRRGINGNGYQLLSRTHYAATNDPNGQNYNAFWDGSRVTYGEGDGVRPFDSLDIAAHEITHGLTQFTAGLNYTGQSGGANESFSDIFGTAVEFYTNARPPDYLVGEDVGTIRSMSNPRSLPPSIDSLNQYYPGIDVHYSSGIQNVVYYLMSEGGNHPSSGVYVSGIGHNAAEAIFYRTLTTKIPSSANFYDIREGCMSAAEDLYGAYSPQWNATSTAWAAAGVSNPIDDQQFFVHQLYLDFLNYTDPGGEAYWTRQITDCGNDTSCIDRKRLDVALAFFYTSEDYNTNPAFSNPNTPTYNDAFVQLCYLYQGSTNQGFLQRLPDPGGKAFWLNILNNQIPNDYRGVARAFITSYEYRRRFVPHA